jgi:tRNA-Thr(GGU) m(6)t(6)A37 methyltransferase TsaA
MVIMESSEQPPSPTTPLPAMRAIGVVRTEYSDPESTPIQAAVSRAELGQVELFDDYQDGLDGLADFDYAWLLTWLDNPYDPNETPAMRQVPFLLRPQRRKIGVFASRGPRRVNSIGLSLIKVGRVGLSGFSFAGVDMIDGTPVLDVKPYVTQYDRPPGDAVLRCGWFDTIPFTEGTTPADFGRRPDPDPPGRS